MNPDDLREFARRARAPVVEAKREHWRAEAQSGDGLGAFYAAQDLYEHAVALGVFPQSAEQRAEDFAHHVRLKELIDRASAALGDRSTAR
jgi:hypothetical protein